jgi:alpha-galactosidase/6-phospho-beta-glucosidase family protein
MNRQSPFRITYVGGGSRFVVTLLHGLAAYAGDLRALGRPIELVLMDPDTVRAGEMARYAAVTQQQTGLPMTVRVTDDRIAALQGADWVVFSIGVWDEVTPITDRLRGDLFPGNPEMGPSVAIEAAAEWPYVRQLAADMRDHCPDALFATLSNPTDVLAAAVSGAFGLRAVGLCVEVPQLVRWLAFHLRVPYEAIHIDYLGVNHSGWVSAWSIDGVEDPVRYLDAALEARMAADDWDPINDAFVHAFRMTGLLRSSPYHHSPFVLDYTAARRAQIDPFYARRAAFRQRDFVGEAVTAGRMIPEDVPHQEDGWFARYRWPSTRFTLGSMALGLAGGEAGPVPIQTWNGSANPDLAPDAWLEVPTRVVEGKLLPQTVLPLPAWAISQLAPLADQRMLLARWLAADDADALAQGLAIWPNVASTDTLLSLIRELPAVKDRDVA